VAAAAEGGAEALPAAAATLQKCEINKEGMGSVVEIAKLRKLEFVEGLQEKGLSDASDETFRWFLRLA
jgi:hypothetical protein